jgi:uncharacterized protein YndB with AHSA1/START domain
MTSGAYPAGRVLGILRTADGKGIVRIEDRVQAGPEDLWSALTEPGRLANWLGDVEGDLRLGGEFSAHFFASGWKGTGHIDACEPPRRLRVLTKSHKETEASPIEVTLTPAGEETILVWEERGMPIDLLPAYGAGIQIHVEDLLGHIAGRERCDAEQRWAQLQPYYEQVKIEAA